MGGSQQKDTRPFVTLWQPAKDRKPFVTLHYQGTCTARPDGSMHHLASTAKMALGLSQLMQASAA